MQNQNNLRLLDWITLISFGIGLYALYIALENLRENEEQSITQQELLHKVNNHLHSQDDILSEQTEIYLKQINDKLDKLNS